MTRETGVSSRTGLSQAFREQDLRAENSEEFLYYDSATLSPRVSWASRREDPKCNQVGPSRVLSTGRDLESLAVHVEKFLWTDEAEGLGVDRLTFTNTKRGSVG
jgi:hypothetical protein